MKLQALLNISDRRDPITTAKILVFPWNDLENSRHLAQAARELTLFAKPNTFPASVLF